MLSFLRTIALTLGFALGLMAAPGVNAQPGAVPTAAPPASIAGSGPPPSPELLADIQRLQKQGRGAEALAKADAFLARKPGDAQMRFVRGVLLSDAGRTDEAIEVFRKLNDDFPDLAEPYNNLAALYASRGDYTRARGTLELALRANPSYAVAHENLGDVYAALASESYARAQKLDPSSTSLPPKLALVRELFKPTGDTPR